VTVKISIIDYGMGNLKSVSKILDYLKVESVITSKPKLILDSDGVILPGVGAFGDAMKNLKEKNLIPTINQVVAENTPLFGICLGLQLFYSKGFEMGEYNGLDIIKGTVILFDKLKVGKIPQIGWNNVNFQIKDHFLVQGIPNNSYFYFVHSYYGIPENRDNILGTTNYGETEFASIICKDNIVAAQFHPEKSGKYGIKMMQNFVLFCKT
jgi:glutamine amidotransferase